MSDLLIKLEQAANDDPDYLGVNYLQGLCELAAEKINILENSVDGDCQKVIKALNHDNINGAYASMMGVNIKIKELEQQLSNSISKDELRGLIEKMEQDQHFAWSATLQTAIEKLNKLIEGDNNE